MMNRAEIQKFFLLENNPQLFETALCPRSCGGGAEFEQLALYGDLVIDMHLLDYFINEDFQQNGDLTEHNGTIHNKNMIKAFADDLGIPDILTRSYSTYHPETKDLKETVEALIGAAFKANGLEKCKPIILTLAKFAQEIQETSQKQGEFDTSKNYKGKLNELFQKKHLDLPNLEPARTGGPDNSAIYQFEGDVIFDGKKLEIPAHDWPRKDLAEQEAAYLALLAITGNNPEYSKYDPRRDMPVSQEKTVHPTTSIDDEELIFHKSGHQNTSMKAKQDTGELLVEYVNRKAKKNVFSLLKLLSGRLGTVVSGASWTCEFSSGVLALIYLQLGEQNYFAVGFGPSKTQARKAAGEDMLRKVNLTEWLNIHYPDHTI